MWGIFTLSGCCFKGVGSIIKSWYWELQSPAYLCTWVKVAWNSCSEGSG